jgi:hypothetical protein
MQETSDDIDWLQGVLDATYRDGGAHLRNIHTDRARVPAADLVQRLEGMQILVVATVSSDGRPFTGPVDGFLYRGRFHFGTDPGAVRARHLARNPAVSATHVRGEELVVTVHGTVRPLDLAGADRDFGQLVREWYGSAELWESAATWAIEPTKMLAADMSVHTAPG